MNRREYLSVLSAAGLAPALAGCSTGDNGGGTSTPTTTSEPDISNQTFEYFFQDTTGTLGQVGDEEVPEDAEDWQVVHNELEESDWDEMQSNDLDGAREIMERDYDSTINDIVTRTEEILQNPEEELTGPGYDNNVNPQEDPTAVIYTAALVMAGKENDIVSSGGKDQVLPSIAEPVLEQLDLEIPGFSLSTNMATEAMEQEEEDPGPDGVPRNVAPEEADSELMRMNSGFSHPIGLLQYENEDGEQEVKYVEVTGHEPPFNDWIRDPEESIYARPLEEGSKTVGNQRVYPHHFLTSFEYSKGRELQDMDAFRAGELDNNIAATLYHIVDDLENDSNAQKAKSYGDTPGWDIIVEDSFGESLEEFKRNPTKEKSRYVENAARGMKLAFERHGYDEPLRLSGTVEDPTYEHLARTEFESIIDERQERMSS